jgi:hypothetical protein
MQISLSKALAILDAHRGDVLDQRKLYVKGTARYVEQSVILRRINQIKKELALVSDADQLPLGL